TTFSRSQRRSAPSLMVWRPFSHDTESAMWVTLVLKSVAVFGGEPSCWYPEIRHVGNVLGNRASDGIPGRLSPADADVLKSAADRATVRRVSPTRSSLRARSDMVRW